MNAATIVALATLATLLAGTTAPAAMFVVYRGAWALTTGDIGIVFAAYVGTLLPVLLCLGGVADRIGRRGAVAIGLALALSGLALLSVAGGTAALVVARLFQGAGMGIASGALTAAFTETYRGRVAAGIWSNVASGVGVFLGPLMAATAFDRGAPLHAVYLPVAMVTVVCACLLPLLPGRPSAHGGDAETPLPQRTVAAVLRFALPVTFVGWSGLSLFLSMVPAYLAATLHATDPIVGAGVISALQIASIGAALALRGWPPERGGIGGAVAVVVGLTALVAGTALHGAAAWSLVALATLLVGAAGGVTFAAAISVANRVARGQRARIFSRIFVASYLGFAAPSLLVGVIAARSSLAIGFAVAIAALAAVAAALPALRAGVACAQQRVSVL
ncbi:MAG: major facilitator superfamily 1 [Candidatus Eremiobacteraeota bacterium]|nr:major facilitator superfamily 1 [Candidatus Eremiobacteraeota bacterium]